MQDLISIIIIAYNSEDFIAKCIESALNQTYKNLEIVIVNDGSTDNTLKICKSYNDNRIKLINQENKGISKSRNIGIENSTGKYLYFIDSDDYVELDVIEYLYNLIQQYDADIATCRPIDIFDYDFKIKNPKEKIEINTSKEMLKKILLSTDRAVVIWNKLMKKELFENIRFEDRIINDMVVTHKLVIKANKIIYSNQIKYYYLKHRTSVTAIDNIKIERYIDNYDASIERYEYIKELYPDLIENDIFLIRNIVMLYMVENQKVIDYIESKDAMKRLKDCFSYKILLYPMKISKKMKIIIFMINVYWCKIINKKWYTKKYKYKM